MKGFIGKTAVRVIGTGLGLLVLYTFWDLPPEKVIKPAANMLLAVSC